MRNKVLLLLLALLLALLPACGKKSTADTQLPVGGLWDAPAVNDKLDWQSASALAQEQHAGYLLAGQTLPNFILTASDSAEGDQQDDVQTEIRQMAEKKRVVAVMGATSNVATMRAASLVNFFNIPMVIPSADGSNLLPSSNLWAFRLSPSAAQYSTYLFGTLLNKATSSAGVTLPGARVAILYEQNTFGESAAVAAAEAALGQGMKIAVYGSYPASPYDPDRVKALVKQVGSENANIVYLVSSSPENALSLVKALTSSLLVDALPIIVGQAGGFTSPAFVQEADAAGVYVLRQQIVPDKCPAGVDSIYQAQTYAAAFLLDYSVRLAQASSKTSGKISITSLQSTDTITALREAVRDQLKIVNLDVPCLGEVAFDNTGQNKSVKVELTQVTDGKASTVTAEAFQSALLKKEAGVSTESSSDN